MFTRLTNSTADFVNQGLVYLSLGVIGIVISVLYFILDGDQGRMLTTLFVTITVLVTLRLITERSYYRRHNAITSSFQFVALPFMLIIYVQLFGLSTTVPVYFTISVMGVRISFTALSVVVFPFVIYMNSIFGKILSKRWVGFAILTKLYKSRTVPLLLQISMSGIVIFLVYFTSQIDLSAGFFPVISLYQLLKYRNAYPLQISSSSNQGRISQNRPESTTAFSRGTSRTSARRGSGIPLTPRNGQRTVSTSVRNRRSGSQASPSTSARRSTKTTASTVKRSQRKPKGSSTKRSRSVAHIDNGIDVSPVKKVNAPNRASSILPSGKITKSDLACSICYSEFLSSDEYIVLCPHCKYPMHEGEFIAWMHSSSLCPRCSKHVPKSGVKNQKYRFSAKDYIQNVLKKL